MVTKLDKAQALAAPIKVSLCIGYDREQQTHIYETVTVTLWGEADRQALNLPKQPYYDRTKGKAPAGTQLWWAVPDSPEGTISQYMVHGCVLVWIAKDRDAFPPQLERWVRESTRDYSTLWAAA